nr:aldehyde dehydrogenase family protein [Planococcus glaciei]
MPAHKRSEILRKAADLLEQRVEEFARTLVLEAGKPIKESRVEVQRAIQVLRFASEGAKAIYGETIPLDSAIGGEKSNRHRQTGAIRRCSSHHTIQLPAQPGTA